MKPSEFKADDLHLWLSAAVEAAQQGGKVLQEWIGRFSVREKSRSNLVTEADEASQSAIVESLKRHFPNHGFLGEENLNDRTPGTEAFWIIDPLDGTTNYVHGFPYYCVSIALEHKGVVTQAVVYDPNKNDLFTATRGRGAYLNDRRIRVGRRDRLSDALVGTGFPFREKDGLDAYARLFTEMTQACTGLRRPGAAALDLANVAAGRLDAFFEQGINVWDMAAGSLLITEAGGPVGNYTGDADFLHRHEIVAANPKIYAQMIPILKGYTHVHPAAE